MYLESIFLLSYETSELWNRRIPRNENQEIFEALHPEATGAEANRNTIQHNIRNNIMVILMIVLMVLCSIVYLLSRLGQQVVLAIRKRIFTPTLYAPQYTRHVCESIY